MRSLFFPIYALWLFGCGVKGSPDTNPVQLEAKAPFPLKERTDWPTRGWQTAKPEEVGLDPAALSKLEEYVMRRTGDDNDRKGPRTNAFVVIKDGKLVLERYARGYTPETPLLIWSVTKSITNTLIGIAQHQQKLNINDPASKYYKPLDTPEHKDIRITDFLRMSSGIEWNETYETSPIFSSVMAMLYTRGRADMARFVSEQPQKYAPGAHWSYSSGDTNVLSAVLQGAVGDAYATFPWKELFDKLGIQNAVLERDAAGTFVGSSYLYITARDLAKWAYLYLNDGVWEGQRILPEGWVNYTLTMAPAYYKTEIDDSLREDNPGAQFYLNIGDPTRNIDRPWPEAPPDTFAGLGHWGKSVYVIPSLDLIVVRLADDREYGCHHEGQTDCNPDWEKAYSKRQMLKLLVASVKK